MQNGTFNQITGRRAPPTWQAEILRLQVAAPGLIKPKKGSLSTLNSPTLSCQGGGSYCCTSIYVDPPTRREQNIPWTRITCFPINVWKLRYLNLRGIEIDQFAKYCWTKTPKDNSRIRLTGNLWWPTRSFNISLIQVIRVHEYLKFLEKSGEI